MYEDGIGRVISGVETARASTREEATPPQRTQDATVCRRFDESVLYIYIELVDSIYVGTEWYAFYANTSCHGGLPRRVC